MLFNALNFSSFPWNIRIPPGGGPYDPAANQTALRTTLAGFLCPSDSDEIEDEENSAGQAHNNYRANAGTLPHNFAQDSPDGTGRNTGPFWFQSAIRPSNVSDGLSHTAFFSERCLGIPDYPDPLADYYYFEYDRDLPYGLGGHAAVYAPLRVVERAMVGWEQFLHALPAHLPPAVAELPADRHPRLQQPGAGHGHQPASRRRQRAPGRRIRRVRQANGLPEGLDGFGHGRGRRDHQRR